MSINHSSLTIKHYQTYPEYKESEVEWLGEIPTSWELRRLASFGSFSKCGGFSKSDLKQSGVKAFLYGDIYTQYNIQSQSPVRFVDNETAEKSVIIQTGDLLFSGSGEDVTEIGKCITYTGTENVVGGGDIIKFSPKRGSSVFLSYALNSNGVNFEKSRSSKGEIIVHTYASKLRTIRIPFPPHSEQIAVANFLDDKVSKIDEAIAQKEQLIQLLNERKQIIIQNAVTKGLNPNAPMKDSGIEWIGKIPEHWKVKKLKFLSTYFKGYAFSSRDFAKSGIPIVKASNIKKHNITPSQSFIAEDNQREEFEGVRLKSGDVIISTVGSRPEIVNSAVGQLAQLDETFSSGYLNQNTVCFTPNSQVIAKFMKLVLVSDYARSFLNSISLWIANQAYLEVDSIRELAVPLPPLTEQNEIVRNIEAATSKIVDAQTHAHKSINKLKEYKASLINSAVTGKIMISG